MPLLEQQPQERRNSARLCDCSILIEYRKKYRAKIKFIRKRRLNVDHNKDQPHQERELVKSNKNREEVLPALSQYALKYRVCLLAPKNKREEMRSKWGGRREEAQKGM